MGQIKDLTGQRFGRLVALEMAGRNAQNSVIWRCLCDCGNEKLASSPHLGNGHISSCGCFQRESARARVVSHQRSGTPEYNAWAAMIGRCERPTDKSFSRYGGRGIKVAPEWRADFVTFLRDMGERPSPEHSLDRIDNDGNYEPGNVRWATKREQTNNRRNTRTVEFRGEKMALAFACDIIGISCNEGYERLIRGLPLDQPRMAAHPVFDRDAATGHFVDNGKRRYAPATVRK